MHAATKTLLASLALSLVAVGLVVLGFTLGRRHEVLPIQQQIRAFARSATLGSLMTSSLKSQAVVAYDDEDEARRRAADFSWAVPNMPTPFVGSAPVPGEHGNAIINSMQFRAEREVEMPKPDGVYRVFLTGGSVAFGTGAPSQDRTLSAYVERALEEMISPLTGLRYEVWSAGNPGWVSTHERIWIENRLSELAPDLVISFSGNNDVHWGEWGRNILWFRTYSEDHLFWLVNHAYEQAGYAPFPVLFGDDRPAPVWQVAKRLIKNVEIAAWTLDRVDARYAFILQPTLPVESKRLTDRERQVMEGRKRQFTQDRRYFRRCFQAIDAGLKNVEADNFTYRSLVDVFATQPDGTEIYVDAYHYGDRGNRIVADALVAAIREDLVAAARERDEAAGRGGRRQTTNTDEQRGDRGS